jgi:hypothetical protein
MFTYATYLETPPNQTSGDVDALKSQITLSSGIDETKIIADLHILRVDRASRRVPEFRVPEEDAAAHYRSAQHRRALRTEITGKLHISTDADPLGG